MARGTGKEKAPAAVEMSWETRKILQKWILHHLYPTKQVKLNLNCRIKPSLSTPKVDHFDKTTSHFF